MVALATLLLISTLIIIPGGAYGAEGEGATTTTEGETTSTTMGHDGDSDATDSTTTTSTVDDPDAATESTTTTSTVDDPDAATDSTTTTSTVDDPDAATDSTATTSRVDEKSEAAEPEMVTRLLEGVPVQVPAVPESRALSEDVGAGILADVPSDPNPPLSSSCGLNIALVFDQSGSVVSFETEFKDAAKAFVDALQGTPSTIGLTGFAGISEPFGNGIGEVWGDMTEIATVSGADTVKASIDAIPFGGLGDAAGTNWQDGFKVVGGTDEPPSSGGLTPPIDVILFMTDGNPTTHDGSDDVGFSADPEDLDAGVVEANIWKTAGTRIIALGIGDAIDVSNLIDISGPTEGSDYFLTDFDTIGDGLEDLAIASCTSTITITKHVDDNNDGMYEVSDGNPDWTFEADATHSAGTLTWQNPAGTNPVSDTVGADGIVLFDWLLDDLTATTDVDITETVNDAWRYDPQTACTVKTFEAPDPVAFPVTENGTGDGFTLSTIPRDGVIACDVFNTIVEPALTLIKTVTPTVVSSPGVVDYSFTIENTGNTSLTNVTLTDALPGVVISGGPIGSLPIGGIDSTTFTGTYTVTQADIDAGDPIVNTATASSIEGAQDSDDATVTITQSPAMTLLKTGTVNDGGDGVDAGDTITYAFTVTNTGNTTLTGITIDDPVAGVVVVGGPIDLAPGVSDSSTFTGEYTITQADIDAGEFENCATANGIGPDGETPVASNESCTTDTLPQTSLIDLVKQGTIDLTVVPPDDQANVGDVISYTFTITNTGNTTLTDVTVTDTIGGVTIIGAPIASMAPGEVDSTTYTGTYAVTQTDIDAGLFENVATVTGTDPNEESVTDTDDDLITALDEPALLLTKTVTPMIVSAPQTVNYAFTVENIGNATLTNITLTDALPGVVISGGPIGSLAVGATDSTTFTGTYDVTQADIDAGLDIVNTATATSNEGAEDTDDATVTVIQTPGMTVLKDGVFQDESGDGFAQEGETIDYTFTVTNTGNTTLLGITISDANVMVVGGPIDSLAPGAVDSTTFTATYTITQADIDAGLFENCATANSGEVASNESCTTDDLPQNPSIDLVKTGVLADTDGSGSDTPGDVISYEFTITNTGNVTLTNVALTDPDVTDAACDWSTASLGSSEADLLPTESVECTGTDAITQADIDLGFRDNTATATGTPPAGGDVNDDDTETVDIVQEPALELVKTADPTSVTTPGTVNYSFTVENTGNVTLTNITLTDILVGVAVSGGPIASLAPGDTDTDTFTATFNVTQVHIDAGDDIVNTATATAEEGATDDDTQTVTVVQEPDLAILKDGVFNDESGDGFAQVGETISYTFIVSNIGNVTLTDITITDVAPGVVVTGGPIDLVPGATDSFSFTAEYSITQADIDAGEFENCATADGTPPGEEVDDVTSNESCTTDGLPPRADIDLIKTGTFEDESGDGFADVGETISYVFTVENTGDVTLTDVTLVDIIGGVSISGSPIGTMAPGAVDDTTFTGTYAVTQDDIDNGNFHNVAIITGTDPNSDPVSDPDENDTRLPQNPMIELIKNGSLDLGDDGMANPGDPVVYTFTVTNTGNVTLFAPALTDLSMLGLDVSCPWDGVADYALGLGLVNRVNCTATYLLTQADIDAGEVFNEAIVVALSPAEDPVEDTDDFTLDSVQDPDIEIIKTAVDPEISEGESAVFTIDVTNTGNVTLHDVVVTDFLSPDCDRVFGAILTPGETVSYECTVDDVDADFTNVAVVTGVPPVVDEEPPGEVTDEDDADVVVLHPEFVVDTGICIAEDVEGIELDRPFLAWASVNWAEGAILNMRIFDRDMNLYSEGTVVNAAGSMLWPGYDDSGFDPETGIGGIIYPPEELRPIHIQIYTNPETPVVLVEYPPATDGCTPNPAIDVVKDVEPDPITVGEPTEVTWTVTVTNIGDSLLTNVELTDDLVPQCDLIVGNLDAGASVVQTCTATYTPDSDAWTATNTVVATGIGLWGTEVTDEDDATVTAIGFAAIGDTVWNDENENGLQDGGENGVEGVTVRLTKPDGTTHDATTDAEGMYLFSDLPAGEYTSEIIMSSVELSADGAVELVTAGFLSIPLAAGGDHVDALSTLAMGTESDPKLTTAGSFTVQLDGVDFLDADFGVVVALPDTGIDADSIAVIGLVLLLGGAVAVLVTTRRRRGGHDIGA